MTSIFFFTPKTHRQRHQRKGNAEQEIVLKKEEKSILSPNNALVRHSSNLKTERESKKGRELFLDKYLVMGYNEA